MTLLLFGEKYPLHYHLPCHNSTHTPKMKILVIVSELVVLSNLLFTLPDTAVASKAVIHGISFISPSSQFQGELT